MCADGYGTLDVVAGTMSINEFTNGLYICGKELLAGNAGSDCTDDSDCYTNYSGVYSKCECTYKETSKKCDILTSNSEY
jgi:hypothetical protein